MIKEFRDFAVKGNVIDLAIGVIIGAAFSKIVTSLIEDVLTPLLLQPAMKAAKLTRIEDLTILGSVKYGLFLAAVIHFVIVSIVLFLVVKAINSYRKKANADNQEKTISEQEKLLTEIRDALKSNS